MKKLLLVLFSSLVLAGCAQEGLSQNELFEKKQECAKYVDYNKDGSYEMFYSVKVNSCIYSIQETMTRGIYDALTKETIYESESPLKCSANKEKEVCEKIETSFEKKMRELKGE